MNDTRYKGISKSNKLNLHHLRPIWAGGEDKPMNFWIVPAMHQRPRGKTKLARHKTLFALQNSSIGKHDNIHDWWAYNLFWAFNKKLSKKQKCFLKLDPKPRIGLNKKFIGTYTENNITNIAEKFGKASPSKKVYIRMSCDEFCKEWKK